MAELRLPLRIASDHPSLAGHFPGQPIVPGVVLLDAVIRAAARHVQGWSADADATVEIAVCKFLQPVAPATALELTLAEGVTADTLSFRLQHGDQLVASGSLRREAQPS